jgi:predicted Zn-dependent protease
MQTYFYDFADYLNTLLKTGETYLAWLSAEQSDFIRFNNSAVRQATSVKQIALTVTLIANGRRAEIRLMLSGQPGADRAQVRQAVGTLRRDLGDLPEDPYLLYSTAVHSTEKNGSSALPDPAQVLDEVIAAGSGLDLVGLYAGGPIYKGFANSLGQRNWHRVDNFSFEWCLYHAADKAVKSNYAGARWESGEFARKMEFARKQLAKLGDKPLELKPGKYRVYLAPSAMNEILGMLCWGGFGAKSQRTKQSCLLKMLESGAAMHSEVALRENTRDGIAGGFQQDGFIKADTVSLINRGKLDQPLISPRSAKEYVIATNGANAYETPESLDMAGGSLVSADALKTLDTGILIGNLWYLNFSDRPACRLTGMTRFATFWVENGEIKAPLNVMRFDDSAYRVLGENLLGLTRECDLLPSSASYGERSTDSTRLPGALVKDLALTL